MQGLPPEPDPPCRTLPCTFPDCKHNQTNKTLGLCNAHYLQHWRGEELTPLKYRVRLADTDLIECKECHTWKPKTDYHIKSTGWLVSRMCKKCYNERAKYLQHLRKLRKQGVNI